MFNFHCSNLASTPFLNFRDYSKARLYAYCFPCGSAGKDSTCNAGDLGSIPGLGRSPGEEKGYPLQYYLSLDIQASEILQYFLYSVKIFILGLKCQILQQGSAVVSQVK